MIRYESRKKLEKNRESCGIHNMYQLRVYNLYEFIYRNVTRVVNSFNMHGKSVRRETKTHYSSLQNYADENYEMTKPIKHLPNVARKIKNIILYSN